MPQAPDELGELRLLSRDLEPPVEEVTIHRLIGLPLAVEDPA